MTKILDKSLVDTNKMTDIIVTILIIIGAFFVPTFLAKIVPLGKYQQIVVGSIVNMSLILTALYTKGTIKVIAASTLPSLSTLCGGLLFSSMTIYSRNMIPAIWLGNLSLILIYKVLFVNKKMNYILSAVCAVLIKAAIIYSGFLIMTSLMTIPQVAKDTLNNAMGLTQLITASIGSILAFGIVKITSLKAKEEK